MMRYSECDSVSILTFADPESFVRWGSTRTCFSSLMGGGVMIQILLKAGHYWFKLL